MAWFPRLFQIEPKPMRFIFIEIFKKKLLNKLAFTFLSFNMYALIEGHS